MCIYIYTHCMNHGLWKHILRLWLEHPTILKLGTVSFWVYRTWRWMRYWCELMRSAVNFTVPAFSFTSLTGLRVYQARVPENRFENCKFIYPLEENFSSSAWLIEILICVDSLPICHDCWWLMKFEWLSLPHIWKKGD
jgi:hypothetical protein